MSSIQHIVQHGLMIGAEKADKHPKTATVTAVATGIFALATGGVGLALVGLVVGAAAGGLIGEVVDDIKK